MKYIMFSRKFPAYHPKKGQDTEFITKVMASLFDTDKFEVAPKHHTIRGGSRWKVGDVFSARYWEGLPYRSRQIEFAEIQIKQIWEFELKWEIDIFGRRALFGFINGNLIKKEGILEFSQNDGLSIQDMNDWFTGPFKGQIICWNDKIKY